jgi:hypothetical protein
MTDARSGAGSRAALLTGAVAFGERCRKIRNGGAATDRAGTTEGTMVGHGWRRLALVVAGTLLFACSSKTAPAPAPSGAPVAHVDAVVVTVGAAIGADERRILDEVNGAPRLRTAIEGELGKAGKLETGGGRVLEVEITDFRLRSGATVFFAGIMAGVDTLYVRAVVRQDGRVIRELTTGDSTSGGFAGLSSSSRFQTMADALAERLRAAL